jgi:NAD kinase
MVLIFLCPYHPIWSTYAGPQSVDVQIEDEEEPYETAWALDSDDDCSIQEMTE